MLLSYALGIITNEMNDEVIIREIFVDLVTFFLGIWLILDRIFLNIPSEAAVNDFVIGVTVSLLALSRMLLKGNPSHKIAWANTALGLWLIAAPFIIGYQNNTKAMINNIIIGVAIFILSIWTSILRLISKRYPNIFGS